MMQSSTAATDIDDYLYNLDECGILDSKWYGLLDYVHSYPIKVLCGCGAEIEMMNKEMGGSKCSWCDKVLFPKLTEK